MMLHRLEIENFYSMYERQIIDLRAATNVPDASHRLAPLWRGSDEKAPKVVAFFGANASGKSNVLRALSFLAWFVKDSFAWTPGSPLPFERFNRDDASQAPTYLAIQAGGMEIAEDRGNPDAKMCRYAYEVQLSGGLAKTILAERLYYWPSHAARRVRLFERDATGPIKGSKAFISKSHQQALDKLLRPNASVISTLAQLGHDFSKKLCHTAGNVMRNIFIEKAELQDQFVVDHYLKNDDLTRAFNKDIERIDAGIKALIFQPGPNGPLAFFSHEGLGAPVPLVFESHGTRQFMKLYPIIMSALATGGIAVIDELDSALHPLIAREILSWFHSPERNPHDAQLWMSCQNASLLEDLIKDEVFFCEKDGRGQTHVYGLRDIQSVRRDENYYRKYLGGSYGAIPQIG